MQPTDAVSIRTPTTPPTHPVSPPAYQAHPSNQPARGMPNMGGGDSPFYLHYSDMTPGDQFLIGAMRGINMIVVVVMLFVSWASFVYYEAVDYDKNSMQWFLLVFVFSWLIVLIITDYMETDILVEFCGFCYVWWMKELTLIALTGVYTPFNALVCSGTPAMRFLCAINCMAIICVCLSFIALILAIIHRGTSAMCRN